ncbi:MAG: nitroreductase family deazaflavin-dependent oxidoreductase [Actinomycetota bacterium]|nr:nitroreductase family deazaflavin-dependent oxidoreductase [Actinomycetota bacterium]HWM33739.1 nitroreductase/quinone reductase family protein [Pseudolysinimonas sp.]
MSGWNERVIAEFRANDGVTKGWGKSLVVMHTIGAKSGELRLAPVMGRRDDSGGWFVVASKGGAPEHPAWYHNLLAHPRFDVEAHIDGAVATVAVEARELDGAEYDAAWQRFVSRSPVFQDYADKAGRKLPIFHLVRSAG